MTGEKETIRLYFRKIQLAWSVHEGRCPKYRREKARKDLSEHDWPLPTLYGIYVALISIVLNGKWKDFFLSRNVFVGRMHNQRLAIYSTPTPKKITEVIKD